MNRITDIVLVIAYALTIAALVYAFAACSAYRTVESYGKTSIVVVDTTTVEHRGNYNLKLK